MRIFLQYFSALILWLILLPVQAHEGHDHGPVSMKKAVAIALVSARDFSLNAQPQLGLPQLEQSWGNLPDVAAQIVENGRGYYLVKVDNPMQAKTLYVRILLDGRVDAANFSGDFNSPVDTKPAIP